MIKKQILTLGIVIFCGLSVVSCRDTVKEETVVKEVEADREAERVEVEIQEEEDKGILERTGEKIDQEVNDEIDEEIDNIGDDNPSL